jgi:hypothetical protein
MGLDGTIKRGDGRPLGDVEFVQQALAAAFPGIVFGTRPSGVERIHAASELGVTFPDALKQPLERLPAILGGDYHEPAFSAQFGLGASANVQQIDLVLYGDATAATAPLRMLDVVYGWVTTHL